MENKIYILTADVLGQITLPNDVAENFCPAPKTELKIMLKENKIILLPYIPVCDICKSSEYVFEIGEKKICSECMRKKRKKEDIHIKNDTEPCIIRKIDGLFRLVLPVAYRKALKIEANTKLNLTYSQDRINISIKEK